MPQRLRAEVNPDALNWARRVAGFSIEDAARRAGASVTRLEAWEGGAARPTFRQLRLLARAYRRPSAFFFRTELPPEPSGLPDFRLLPDTFSDDGDSPDLIYEIRRAQVRRETALEILALMGHSPAKVDLIANRREGAEAIGQRLRDYLGVTLPAQSGWNDQYEALREWTRAVEARGILVFQFSRVEVREARGFSLADAPLPVVALNGKDAPRGRIFTLLHELAHVALGKPGLCDMHDQDQVAWLEPFCNAVAAEALVPTASLRIAHEVTEHAVGPEWDDRVLLSLSNRFMVSREVILRRLLTLGMTNVSFYENRRAQFAEEYEGERKGQGGFLQYFRRVLRDNGATFTSLVLTAYDQKTISERDLSHHLGDVKLAHVDSIRGVLAGTSK